MTTQERNETEQKILAAAKEVFTEKGYEGARMQEIADKAGINKALMHYYFRSKDNLFHAIFKDAFFTLVPKLSEAFISDIPFMDKVESFVTNYLELVKQNPHIPMFVLHELTRNPGFVQDVISNHQSIPFNFWLKSVEVAVEREEIIPINPRHLLVNMLSLCVFPFVGRPILKSVIFNHNDKEFDKFLAERQNEVVEFIRNSIAIEPKS